MSPRKVRRVAQLVRGLSVARAEAELAARKERAAVPLRKLLQSAIANAKSMSDAQPSEMRIASCVVNNGPAQRRFRPRSRGTVHPVLRRTSHVSLVLDVPERAKRVPARTGEAQEAQKIASFESGATGQQRGVTEQEERWILKRKGVEERTKRRLPKLPIVGQRFFHQRKSV